METRDRPAKRRTLIYWLPVMAVAAIVVGFAGLTGLEWWILGGAHERGAIAMREFPGDRVEALSALVQSEGHSLTERNRAVWALGQIADPRALPGLQRYYTGGECDHARFLCQYELKKAIDRCNGKNRPPRWLPFQPRRPAGS